MSSNEFTDDELLFGKYLFWLRNKANISAEELGRGICSGAEISYIENGKRCSSKLLRDLLLERTGIVSEEYESFLNPEEYSAWVERQKIVRFIINRDFDSAFNSLVNYNDKINSDDSLEMQFIYSMKALIYELLEKPEVVIRTTIAKALKMTFQDYEECRFDGWFLSVKEICLLVEYYNHLENNDKSLDSFKELYAYVNRLYNKRDRARTFIISTLACKYARKVIQSEERFDEHLINCFNLLKEALSLLCLSRRLYYINEIYDCAKKLIDIIRTRHLESRDIQEKYIKVFLNSLEKTHLMIEHLEELAGIRVSDNVWASSYLEEGCYCIGDVILQRRKMMNLTRAALAEGICSEKTIMRVEKKVTGIHYPVMRELFEKMGISGEYERGFLVLSNPLAKEVEEKANRLATQLRFEEALNKYEELRELVPQTSYNLQFILGIEAFLLYRMGMINLDEYIDKQEEALKYTIELESIRMDGELFISRNELACLYRIILYGNAYNKNYSELFTAMFKQELKRQELDDVRTDIRTFELLALAKMEKDLKYNQIEEGMRTCETLLKREIVYYRMGVILPVVAQKIKMLRNMRKCNEASETEKKTVELYNMLKEYLAD